MYPVSPPDNTFALPTEVFSSCLAIVSAVTIGGLFLWPALRYWTGYQTVWETRPSAATPSDIYWRRFYFQLTCVHSALELSRWCAIQIYLLTYLMIFAGLMVWSIFMVGGNVSLASIHFSAEAVRLRNRCTFFLSEMHRLEKSFCSEAVSFCPSICKDSKVIRNLYAHSWDLKRLTELFFTHRM